MTHTASFGIYWHWKCEWCAMVRVNDWGVKTCSFSISSLCFRCSSCSLSSYSRCSFADSSCSAWVLASCEDCTWTFHSTAGIETGWLYLIDTKNRRCSWCVTALQCDELCSLMKCNRLSDFWIIRHFPLTSCRWCMNCKDGKLIRFYVENTNFYLWSTPIFLCPTCFHCCWLIRPFCNRPFEHPLVTPAGWPVPQCMCQSTTVMFWNLWLHEGVCDWVYVCTNRLPAVSESGFQPSRRPAPSPCLWDFLVLSYRCCANS